jgi:3-oxoadipate enol-lactonase
MTHRTLVLVHAFPMGARMWDAQRDALDGWNVVTPSLAGFDGRPSIADRSMAGYARDLLDTLDALHVNEAVFGGLSLGGYVLFELLRQAPARVSGLILADTRTSVDTPERRAARERSIAVARTGGARAIADEMVPALLGPTTHARRPDVVARVRALIESQTSDTIVAGLQALMTRVDSAAVLPTIAVPTTIIVGDEDTITPPSDAAFMQARIPGSRLITIHGAGHMSNLEDPAAFNEALNEALASWAPGPGL